MRYGLPSLETNEMYLLLLQLRSFEVQQESKAPIVTDHVNVSKLMFICAQVLKFCCVPGLGWNMSPIALLLNLQKKISLHRLGKEFFQKEQPCLSMLDGKQILQIIRLEFFFFKAHSLL